MNASPILRGRLIGFALLTVVFLTFVGHIAPLPSSAHAPFADPATTHEPSEHGSGASHIASCDATLARPAPSLSCTGDGAPWMVGPIIGLALPRPAAVTTTQRRPGRPDTGVRLFVLHASFLI